MRIIGILLIGACLVAGTVMLTASKEAPPKFVVDKTTKIEDLPVDLVYDLTKSMIATLDNPACNCTAWMASPSVDFPDAYYRICGRPPEPPSCVEFRECYYCVTYPPGGCNCGSGI